MRNKKLIIVLGLTLCISLAGCGNQSTTTATENSKTENVPTSEAESNTESNTEDIQKDSDEAKTTETAQPSEAEAATPQEVSGTVKSFTGAYLTIVQEDEETLEFELSDGKLECTNGILCGDQVTIIYNGTIDGTDTSKAMIETVKSKTDKEELTENTMVGTLTDATTNTLTITNEEGDPYIFVTPGASIHYVNGLKPGNWIELTYKGEIRGTNTKNVKVLSVVDESKQIQEIQGNTQVEPTHKKMYALTNENLRENYSLDSDVVESVLEGQQLEVTGETDTGWLQVTLNGTEGYIYQEYLTETPPVTVATPIPAPQLDPAEQTMDATLQSVKNNVITVESETDDQQYVFSCENSEINLSYGLLEGSDITITYLGKASVDETSTQLLTLIDQIDNDIVDDDTDSKDDNADIDDKDSDVDDDDTDIDDNTSDIEEDNTDIDDNTSDIEEDNTDIDDDNDSNNARTDTDRHEFIATGTVLACGKNTMTIMSDDGAQLTCTVDSAELDDMKELPAEGDYIKATMEANQQSNVYVGLEIESVY